MNGYPWCARWMFVCEFCAAWRRRADPGLLCIQISETKSIRGRQAAAVYAAVIYIACRQVPPKRVPFLMAPTDMFLCIYVMTACHARMDVSTA